MPLMLRNYGLGLIEDKETFDGLVGYVASHSKSLPSYGGGPYLFTPTGWSEFWIRTEKKTSGKLNLLAIDSHCKGNCVKTMTCTGLDLSPDTHDSMSRLMVFNLLDNGYSMLPIHVINSEVLPSYLPGDEVTMQLAALPIEISYFANEGEYLDYISPNEKGNKRSVELGVMFPSRSMYAVQSGAAELHADTGGHLYADHVYFKARVAGLYRGTSEIDGKPCSEFIKCIADTQYGMLEFNHSIEQVPEEQRCNMFPGAIVAGYCIISGDVAIDDYKNGIIKDREHDLLALRHTFMTGEADRLRSILADNAEYYTEYYNSGVKGADEVIKRLSSVHKNLDTSCYTYMATISAADDSVNLKYSAGTRCIVIAYGEENAYQSIAFIDCNDEGMIERIYINTRPGYTFKLDNPPEHRRAHADIRA